MTNLGRDALSNYLRFAVTAAVPFVLTPRMLESFGTYGFGLWTLTHSLLSLFSLLDLGLSATLVRYASGKRRTCEINDLLSTILSLYLMVSFVGLIILAAVSWWVSPFRNTAEAFNLLWILGLRTVTLGLPFGVLRSALYARESFLLCNFWQSALALMYGVTAWIALGWSGSLLTLAWVTLVYGLIEHFGYFALLRRVVSGFSLRWFSVNRQHLKSIWSFSAASTLSTLAGLILLKTDPLIVAFFLPLSAVTSYALGLKLAEGVLMLLKQGVNVLTPRFAALWKDCGPRQTGLLFVRACRLSFMGAVALSLPILLLTPELLVAWLGRSDEATVMTTRILVLTAVLSVPQMISSAALSMTGHHLFTARAAVLSAVLNVVTSIVLVQLLGVVGVALGTLVTTLVVDVWIVTRRACRVLGVNLLERGKQ
ncbi:MAG: oligosaccharide flippase family protein [Candidatus Eremiobacteraeota bacterium]|nr:oligosaccharide flippase family protein [Candidatus Eremiobacteraeota bacterium]